MRGSRRGSARAAVALAALIAAAVPAHAQPGAAGPPLIGFHAPRGAPPAAAVAKGALARAAEQRGTAFVDLSPAAPPPAEAPRDLARAIEAYHQVAYDDALARADDGLTEAATSGARGLTPAQLGELYLYRALAASELGDSARAWDDFLRAATVDPTRTLDPARFAPRVVESYQRAVAAVAAQPRLTALVEAPAACRRWLDGREATEAELGAVRGEHIVRVECPGHAPWGASIALATDRQVIRPALVAEEPPGPAALGASAAARGLDGAVLARVTTVEGRAVLVLERVARDGRVARRVSATLGRDAGPAARGALDRLLEVGGPVVATTRPAERRWYEHPLVWGAVGVAVASAILVPIALSGGDGATGFDVEIGPQP